MLPLLEAWGEAVFVLHHSGDAEQGWTVGLETSPELETAEDTITRFVELVRGLTPQLRAHWDRLQSRVLDVGVQAGAEPRSWTVELQPQTLQAMAEIGARLVCTIYAPYEDDDAASEPNPVRSGAAGADS